MPQITPVPSDITINPQQLTNGSHRVYVLELGIGEYVDITHYGPATIEASNKGQTVATANCCYNGLGITEGFIQYWSGDNYDDCLSVFESEEQLRRGVLYLLHEWEELPVKLYKELCERIEVTPFELPAFR